MFDDDIHILIQINTAMNKLTKKHILLNQLQCSGDLFARPVDRWHGRGMNQSECGNFFISRRFECTEGRREREKKKKKSVLE
jgi:hypothetical protein